MSASGGTPGTGGIAAPGSGGVTVTGSGGAIAPGTGGAPAGTGGSTPDAGATPDGGGTGGAGATPDGGGTGGAIVDASQPDTTPPPPSDAGRSDSSGVAYQPCPAKGTVCVIMPLGDSITDGVKSQMRGGYRPPLFHLALQDKKSITFVGDSTPNGPSTVDNVAFPRANEGWDGYTIDQISGLVVNTMNKNKPHIITLMIGTNDCNTGRGSGAPDRLGALIDKIVATNPNVLLVVAQITPTKKPTVNTAAMTYNAALPAIVKARTDAGKHVVLVDMWDAFTKDPNYMTTLMGDDLHPQDSGYKIMADVWYAGLKDALP